MSQLGTDGLARSPECCLLNEGGRAPSGVVSRRRFPTPLGVLRRLQHPGFLPVPRALSTLGPQHPSASTPPRPSNALPPPLASVPPAPGSGLGSWIPARSPPRPASRPAPQSVEGAPRAARCAGRSRLVRPRPERRPGWGCPMSAEQRRALSPGRQPASFPSLGRGRPHPPGSVGTAPWQGRRAGRVR